MVNYLFDQKPINLYNSMIYIDLPIHSFVDLITNSSSETYCCATRQTITIAKKLVNLFLMASNSPHKAEDIFNFDLVVDGEDYDEKTRKYVEVTEVFTGDPEVNCLYNPVRLRIKVKPEWKDSPTEKAMAEVLVEFSKSMAAIEVQQ